MCVRVCTSCLELEIVATLILINAHVHTDMINILRLAPMIPCPTTGMSS